MPVIRFKDKILYFSHIPKCGGTSVENFLKSIPGCSLSFLDRDFYKRKSPSWSISSPQHITGNDASNLFPISFFDGFFTVTRHPFDRFCSAFNFQKYFAKTISRETDINQFISNLEHFEILLPGRFDNHFLPQTHFLYPKASYKAFKLEYGLGSLKEYIGSLLGADVSGISMPHSLRQPEHLKINSKDLSVQSKNILAKIYELDFNNFKY